MTDQTDPTKPTPDKEKFAPQNVADAAGTPQSPSQNGGQSSDPKGRDRSQGSNGEVRRQSNGAR